MPVPPRKAKPAPAPVVEERRNFLAALLVMLVDLASRLVMRRMGMAE